MPERREEAYNANKTIQIRSFRTFGHNKLCPYKRWCLYWTRVKTNQTPSLGEGWGGFYNSLFAKYLTGYHTETKPTATTVRNTTMMSSGCTLTG